MILSMCRLGVSIPASADSHPSQVTPQLVEKTLADAMATEVRVSASASPAVHPYLATPDAMTANPQIRTADSQPHTGSNTHSTQSSSGPKAANFSSSIEKPPQLTPQSQEQSLQLVSRAASLEVDQLLSVLVKEVEQHVNGQQLSHSIAALPAEQHTQQQKALAAAPASAEPSTDSGSTAAISADVYTPHDAQSAAESKPDDMAAVVSTATDSAVDGAAVKQLNRQPLIAVADDPKAQALIVQSGAAMTALPHDDNIHDSSAAIADSAVRADSAVKKDSAVNADSTTNKASDIDENSNLIADSADVDGSAAANDSTPTSQSMMQGRAAMTALPDDDDVSEDATVAESAPAIVSSMLTAADVTSTPQDTWQAKAVMTALPDNDDINEDTADAESATAVDSSILTAAVSAPQTTLHAKAVMMPLPDNEDVDEDVNEDIAHAKPAVAAAVTNSDATGISVKPDASSDTANMEGTAAAGYRDLNDAAVTDARESVLPVISTSSTQQSDAAAVHDTSEVSTSSTQQLHIAADNDTLDSGLSMISTRSTQQLDTAVVDDTLQTLLSEASISSTGQNLPPQQPQTEHEVKQPQTRGGADDLAVAGDAPSEAGVKADKVVQPITALQDSARPWPEGTCQLYAVVHACSSTQR